VPRSLTQTYVPPTDKQVLEAYAAGMGEKKWKPVEQKLKEGTFFSVGQC
jgi:hypothetical protein